MSDHTNSPFLHGEISKKFPGLAGAKAMNRQAALRPYGGGTQKTRSSLPLQARKATARLDRKRGTTATPFGVAKSATPNGAVGRFLRNRSLAAHQGSIPRNSSTFKLSDKLNPARAKKRRGQIQQSLMAGRNTVGPRSTKGTRLDGYTTD